MFKRLIRKLQYKLTKDLRDEVEALRTELSTVRKDTRMTIDWDAWAKNMHTDLLGYAFRSRENSSSYEIPVAKAIELLIARSGLRIVRVDAQAARFEIEDLNPTPPPARAKSRRRR